VAPLLDYLVACITTYYECIILAMITLPKSTSVRLSGPLLKALEARAASQGISRSILIRRLLWQGLDHSHGRKPKEA